MFTFIFFTCYLCLYGNNTKVLQLAIEEIDCEVLCKPDLSHYNSDMFVGLIKIPGRYTKTINCMKNVKMLKANVFKSEVRLFF